MLHPSYRLALFIAASALLACTTPNPLDCSDGTCTDPAHPFCDVDGSLGGTEQSCVAVTCTPNEFKACRGDSALTCNAAGTSYDLTQCADGCDATVGCRLCEANQTMCANGTVQTCDANGAISASQTCPLGCFEDEPRCRDIVPSNDLAAYLDMAASAPDLILVDGDTIYTDAGKISHKIGAPVPMQGTFLTVAAPGGVAIRVVIANHVQITGNVSVQPLSFDLGPALAIVANDEVSIAGTVSFARSGSIATAGCVGGAGGESDNANAGGGGGGHATAGADGGNVSTNPVKAMGGKGGRADGNPTLVPLRGGCAGGSAPGYEELTGGGALQLSSRRKITLHDNAILNLNGFAGGGQNGPLPAYGGGAGGGLLLEAPTVELGNTARLLVNGGGGTITDAEETATSITTAPTAGERCISSSQLVCSDGGNGAAIDGAATGGGDIIAYTQNSTTYVAGGGGGGLGYVRINTITGSYTKTDSTVASGVLTTGSIRSR